MKKKLKMFMCLALALTALAMFGCSGTPAPESTASSETDGVKTYPLSFTSTLTSQATDFPDICYDTPASENGMAGNVYWVEGTVESVLSEDESISGIGAMFSVRTDKGKVWFTVMNAEMIASADPGFTVKDVEKVMDSTMDYTLPKEGETVKVYGIYSGYSNTYESAVLFFGLDPFVYTMANSDSDSSSTQQTSAPAKELAAVTTEAPTTAATTTAAPEPVEEPTEPETTLPTVSLEYRNALSTAHDYLKVLSFSYTGLISQLEYEGYSPEACTYAADNCHADWNEQAAKKAQSYLDAMSFSRQGLIDQLLYEGFTAEQAEYGVTAVGY